MAAPPVGHPAWLTGVSSTIVLFLAAVPLMAIAGGSHSGPSIGASVVSLIQWSYALTSDFYRFSRLTPDSPWWRPAANATEESAPAWSHLQREEEESPGGGGGGEGAGGGGGVSPWAVQSEDS